MRISFKTCANELEDKIPQNYPETLFLSFHKNHLGFYYTHNFTLWICFHNNDIDFIIMILMTINILQGVEFKFNKIHAVFSKIHAERQKIIEKRIKKTKYQEKTAKFTCFQQ